MIKNLADQSRYISKENYFMSTLEAINYIPPFFALVIKSFQMLESSQTTNNICIMFWGLDGSTWLEMETIYSKLISVPSQQVSP